MQSKVYFSVFAGRLDNTIPHTALRILLIKAPI